MQHSQHTANHCSTLQHTATHCNTLQHTATHCYNLQLPHVKLTAVGFHLCLSHIRLFPAGNNSHCHTLQLQHTATHCSTLQHTATHCSNPLQINIAWFYRVFDLFGFFSEEFFCKSLPQKIDIFFKFYKNDKSAMYAFLGRENFPKNLSETRSSF